jgi:hypothetical protein
MTIMGKILVFVILVLAFIQAGLHVMFHVTQTNWEKAYTQLNKQYQVSEAEAKTLADDVTAVKDADAKELARIQNEVKIAQENEKKSKDQVADLQKKNTELRQNQEKEGSILASSQIGSERRQDEVKAMEETLKKRDDAIRDLVDKSNQLRDRAVAAEIESKSLKDRNQGLVDKLQEMTKEMVKVKAGGTASTGMTAKNPPPENVEGIVTKTDRSGLLTLSIGSDDGLTKGHTLEVFRLSPAKYLGTVRIISVTPHEAVAQPVSRPLGTIQQGDRVASKILGS